MVSMHLSRSRQDICTRKWSAGGGAPLPQQQPHQEHLCLQRQYVGQIDGDVAGVVEPAGGRDAADPRVSVEQAEPLREHLLGLQRPLAVGGGDRVTVQERCLTDREQRFVVAQQLVDGREPALSPDGVGLPVQREPQLGMVQHPDWPAVDAELQRADAAGGFDHGEVSSMKFSTALRRHRVTHDTLSKPYWSARRVIKQAQDGPSMDGDQGLSGAVALQVLKSASETLGSCFRKATMAQISWSGTGGVVTPKLGIPVILMPCLTTQNSCCGGRTLTTALRLGAGFRPSENLAGLTPGPPWQLVQPSSEKARAPACTRAASSSDPGG